MVEYKYIALPDSKIQETLDEMAAEGWKLHTYSASFKLGNRIIFERDE